jgi:hypothetical protein
MISALLLLWDGTAVSGLTLEGRASATALADERVYVYNLINGEPEVACSSREPEHRKAKRHRRSGGFSSWRVSRERVVR